MNADHQQQSPSSLPLVILAGRDHRGQPLPEGCTAQWLAGYKAAEWQIDGEPLIRTLVNRCRATGRFDPILVVGPTRVYQPLGLDAELVDSDGELDVNLAAALAALGPLVKGNVALLASDILPSQATLEQALALYDQGPRSVIFFPLVRVPDDPQGLGQSGYKPKYRLIEPNGHETAILPGHLLIFRPQAIRLNLVLSLVRLAYRTRNTPLRGRTWRILCGALGFLLREDLRLLMKGKLPHLTVTVVRNALIVSRSLAQGRISTLALGRRLRAVFVRTAYRVRHPGMRARLPLTDLLELAKDLDTVEEVQATGASRRAQGEGVDEGSSRV